MVFLSMELTLESLYGLSIHEKMLYKYQVEIFKRFSDICQYVFVDKGGRVHDFFHRLRDRRLSRQEIKIIRVLHMELADFIADYERARHRFLRGVGESEASLPLQAYFDSITEREVDVPEYLYQAIEEFQDELSVVDERLVHTILTLSGVAFGALLAKLVGI